MDAVGKPVEGISVLSAAVDDVPIGRVAAMKAQTRRAVALKAQIMFRMNPSLSQPAAKP
jgi:hypothetical protein